MSDTNPLSVHLRKRGISDALYFPGRDYYEPNVQNDGLTVVDLEPHRIIQQYYASRMRNIPRSLLIEDVELTVSIVDAQYLCESNHDFCHVSQLVLQMAKNNPNWIRSILQKREQAIHELKASLIETERLIQDEDFKNINIINLFNKLVTYGSCVTKFNYPYPLLLDNIWRCFSGFPDKLREELIKKSFLLAVTGNVLSCHTRVHIGLLELTEKIMRKEKLDTSIYEFIENYGFLTTGDFNLGSLEIYQNVMKYLTHYLDFYKDLKGIYQERLHIKKKSDSNRLEQCALYDSLLNRCESVDGDRVLLVLLLRWANSLSEYEEEDQYWKRRTLKGLREILNKLSLDVKNTTIEDLDRRIKRKGESE